LNREATRILIVEDEALVRMDLKRVLAGLGYTDLREAGNAEAALALAKSEQPHLVLMDIVLAGGADGIDTANAIQSHLDIPVVYLTGNTDRAVMERAKESSPFGYILKPVEEQALYSTIEMALYKHQADRTLRQSELRYRQLFDEMLNGFALHEMLLDDAGKPIDYLFLQVNPAYEKMTGKTRQDLVGRRVTECLPGTEPYWIDVFGEVARTQKSVRFENYSAVLKKFFHVAAYSPVRGQVAVVFEDITQQKKTEEKLAHRTFHDALTNLPNRALCLDRILQALQRAKRRTNYLYAVLFLDIDRFKMVNDSLGHLAGDKLLQMVSAELSRHARSVDTVARVGGDEFAILLEEIKTQAEAVHVARRIMEGFRTPLLIDGQRIFLAFSIGLVLGPADYDRAEELLQNATIAMNYAKEQGGNRFKVFKWHMLKRIRRAWDVDSHLHQALQRKEFEIHLQPIYHLGTGRLAGFESLVRWRSAEGILVPPGEFIPIAEQTGLILQIGTWVLYESCRLMARWQRNLAGGAPLTMAVNLSAKQFSQPDFIRRMSRLLAETGVEPARLKVEITETMVMENPESVVAKLRGLRELGLTVSIDDFGTGYSSLAYLQRFPINTLKVDRGFVMDMDKYENLVIVKTIVNLAHNLGLDVVAEGIETEEQLATLAGLDCEYGQGYLFSRPMTVEAAETLVRDHFHSNRDDPPGHA
jgi:diguanylate cyclase (GGDEF)-like protein/PAS domain S-box-containing protein